MAKIAAVFKGEAIASAQRIEYKSTLDIRSFLPHEIKEVEEWSWRKGRNEKWFVQLDCTTRRLRRWKLH